MEKEMTSVELDVKMQKQLPPEFGDPVVQVTKKESRELSFSTSKFLKDRGFHVVQLNNPYQMFYFYIPLPIIAFFVYWDALASGAQVPYYLPHAGLLLYAAVVPYTYKLGEECYRLETSTYFPFDSYAADFTMIKIASIVCVGVSPFYGVAAFTYRLLFWESISNYSEIGGLEVGGYIFLAITLPIVGLAMIQMFAWQDYILYGVQLGYYQFLAWVGIYLYLFVHRIALETYIGCVGIIVFGTALPCMALSCLILGVGWAAGIKPPFWGIGFAIVFIMVTYFITFDVAAAKVLDMRVFSPDYERSESDEEWIQYGVRSAQYVTYGAMLDPMRRFFTHVFHTCENSCAKFFRV